MRRYSAIYAYICCLTAAFAFVPHPPENLTANVVLEGVVCRVADREMVLQLDDTRFMWVNLTVVDRNDPDLEKALHVGDRIKVQASVFGYHTLQANTIEVLRSALLDKYSKAAEPVEERQMPVNAATVPNQRQAETEARIQQVREEAAAMTRALPDFLCRQIIKRYRRPGRNFRFEAQDTISTEVLYSTVTGESYRNVLVNGKRSDTPLRSLSGNTSTGEFGSILRSLLRSTRNSDFKFMRMTSVRGKQARLYSFHVDRARADWQIQSDFQFILPPYSGQIWVDANTNRILRIQKKAEEIPGRFPFEQLENDVDYDDISLGDTGTYFLPIRAEMNAKERGSGTYNRNVIQFTDYRKYTGESRLIFGQ